MYYRTMDNNSETEFEPTDDPRYLSPGEIRAIEDHEAKYDIQVWLLTGRTDHFTR